MMHGDHCSTKASPIQYLRSFLTEYSPNCSNKWVVLDQGGEVFCNPAVCNLFKKFGYVIYLTGEDASH